MLRALLLTQLIATWTMVGIIWFVQIVHYPLFRNVGGESFPAYHSGHTRLTTFVVGGPMLAELCSAGLLLWLRPAIFSTALLAVNLGIVALLWISTALVQVPLHDRLAPGFNPSTGGKLVATNWFRTILWTIHGMLGAWMLMVSK
jgi:hypothetical protein